jgi:hypothetical protein
MSAPTRTYSGDRTIDGVEVLVDGGPLNPRYDLLHLTDNGFEWSYEGEEPAQLALALLADHLNDEDRAKRLYRPFMREIVANLDNTWELTAADLAEAVRELEALPR